MKSETKKATDSGDPNNMNNPPARICFLDDHNQPTTDGKQNGYPKGDLDLWGHDTSDGFAGYDGFTTTGGKCQNRGQPIENTPLPLPVLMP